MRAWTPSLETGVAEIDAQHVALFDVAARFADAVREMEPVESLEELFAFLVEYSMDHFAIEERMMREARDPALPKHMQEHTVFKRQLAALVAQWNAEGPSQPLLVAMHGFLEVWLAEHVAKSDQQIAEHARSTRQ